jgi:hypothetical protein
MQGSQATRAYRDSKVPRAHREPRALLVPLGSRDQQVQPDSRVLQVQGVPLALRVQLEVPVTVALLEQLARLVSLEIPDCSELVVQWVQLGNLVYREELVTRDSPAMWVQSDWLARLATRVQLVQLEPRAK